MLDDLLEIEMGFWNTAPEPSYYEEWFAEDGIAVFPFEGGLLDKAMVIDMMKDADPWSSVQTSREQVRIIAPDAGILVYEAIGERDGQRTYHAFISSLYQKLEGRWQLMLHQQTPILES